MERRCVHCGGPTPPEFPRTCGACAGLPGRTVSTPDGFGRVAQLRPTGGIIVELTGGIFRAFTRSQLSVEVSAPVRQPAPEPLIAADRTTDAPPLPGDRDPLAAIRRGLLSRSFGLLANPQANRF